MANDKVKELFAFNLLPPRSKEELAEDAKRATRNFYAGMLPVGIFALGALLFVANNFLLQANLDNWEKSTLGIKTDLANPTTQLSQYKITNGELKTKTDFIADAVDKNVDFNEIFTISENAFAGNSSGAEPTSYGRESTGEFIVNGVASRVNGPSEILGKFKQQPGVEDAQLKVVQKSPDKNEYRFTIGFDLGVINADAVTTTTPPATTTPATPPATTP